MHSLISKAGLTLTLALVAALGAASGASLLVGCSRSDEPTLPTTQQDAPSAPLSFRSEVRTNPQRPRSGQAATLHFTIRDPAGRAVSELPRSHEKPLHVMMVSRDLSRFAHVHPTAEGAAYRLEHVFDEGGEYLLYLDYQQPGRGQLVDRHHVHVGGTAPPAAPLVESAPRQRAGGLELTLHSASALRATERLELHFDATDEETGLPVTDLEPYLGARAHFLVLSEDGEDFVHAHALAGGGPARLSAHTVFPRAGLYKLWVQTQRRGVVVTVPFVLRVGPPPSHPREEPRPSVAHAHDRR